MRMTAELTAIALISALWAVAYAQPYSTCTTIVIEYIGKTDRPVFPIIISASPEQANWYKHKLFNDPVSAFAQVHIVGESTLKEINDIPLPDGDMKRANPGLKTRTSPALRLVLAKGRNSEEITVEASESALLLGQIRKRVSKYPQLVECLADIEGRLNR